MPVAKPALELNAVAGIGYTGASTAAWKAYLYEWVPGKGDLNVLGSWNNDSSTYTKGSAPSSSGDLLLVIYDASGDIDIAEGDTIDVDNSNVFYPDFSIVLPAITSSMCIYGTSGTELWFFIEGNSSPGRAVPFYCQLDGLKSNVVVQQFLSVAGYGALFDDTLVISEAQETEGYSEFEDIVDTRELGSQIPGNVQYVSDNVGVSEVTDIGQYHERIETQIIAEEIFSHGDWQSMMRGGGGAGEGDVLVGYGYDGVALGETVEHSGQEPPPSWFRQTLEAVALTESIKYDNQLAPRLLLVSDTINFGNRDIKNVQWVKVDWGMDSSNPISASVYYRYDSSSAWVQSHTVQLNDEGWAWLSVAGVEFRLVLEADDFSGTNPNGPITIAWKQTGKRSMRGINANQIGSRPN